MGWPPRPSSAADKILLVKGKAGLGNRIQSVLTGIIYARLSGRRLVVDWSDPVYSDDGTNVFHEYFRCQFVNTSDAIPRSDSVAPPVWRGRLDQHADNLVRLLNLGRVPDQWRLFSIDLGNLDYEEEVAVIWTYTFRWQELREHFTGAHQPGRREVMAQMLRQDLVLRPHIRERVERFRSSHLHPPTLGIHVRYSDYKISLDPLIAKTNEILCTRPELQIFLATDNIEIKDLFERLYPGVISTPHWYPPVGKSAHRNEYCPNRGENGVEALVDLYLLAACDYLIVNSSSSYSRMAEVLADCPTENIFDVRGTDDKMHARPPEMSPGMDVHPDYGDLPVHEVANAVPAGETFILVDDAYWDTGGTVAGRCCLPFLERDGMYWGPPVDSGVAIRELERLRRAGASFVVFGQPGLWWLQFYAVFDRYLRLTYRLVLQNERLVIFDLRPVDMSRA